MRFALILVVLSLLGGPAFAESDFQVTGTPIPAKLLSQNYGAIPKGISAFDLSICNVTTSKQSLVSSAVFQALAGQSGALQPIGRDIMLNAIIRNQSHSPTNILNIVFESTTGFLSVLSVAKSPLSASVLTGLALGSLLGNQVISGLHPILSGDQLQKFEAQVLEQAMVLDGGSCVERTVFVISPEKSHGKASIDGPANLLSFHIH